MNIQVIKRDGTKEDYDVIKIKKSIQLACENVEDINPLELESRIDQFLKNGIKTKDIQQNIIQHAIQLSSPTTPQWLQVAGNALAMDQWASFKLRGKTFSEVLEYNIKKSEYTKDLKNYYTSEMISEIGEFLDFQKDLNHSVSSLITVEKKYLGKYELNQHSHLVNAMRFGQFEPKETRVQFVKDVYEILSNRELSLATPFMSNLRKGGNVASCFILAIEDDLGSIFDNIKRIAEISKNGGGLGIFLGYIRAKGSSVGGVDGAAGSVTQWVKIINDTLVAVNQSFTGDTLVETDNGNVPIKDINVGYNVKTHDGTFKPVMDVKSRINDNPIYLVKTPLGEVKVTEGHPVLVVDKQDNVFELVKSGEVKPYWVDVKNLTKDHMIVKSK